MNSTEVINGFEDPAVRFFLWASITIISALSGIVVWIAKKLFDTLKAHSQAIVQMKTSDSALISSVNTAIATIDIRLSSIDQRLNANDLRRNNQ